MLRARGSTEDLATVLPNQVPTLSPPGFVAAHARPWNRCEKRVRQLTDLSVVDPHGWTSNLNVYNMLQLNVIMIYFLIKLVCVVI